MVDSECDIDIYKSVKISIGVVIRNSEILKFVFDHLKTKKMHKHLVKILPFVIWYVPDRCKTRQMRDEAFLNKWCNVWICS